MEFYNRYRLLDQICILKNKKIIININVTIKKNNNLLALFNSGKIRIYIKIYETQGTGILLNKIIFY
jgi:D-arabinose 1-dehydrogenase-like Zn-dependent alcohol dehydrogenase